MEYNTMNKSMETPMFGSDMDRDERSRVMGNRMDETKMASSGRRMSREQNEQIAEEIYSKIDEHIQKALCFHEQLADYFCFLGLQGFKRMLEYQYMKECADKRKLHHKYIEAHHKILPVKQVQTPMFISNDLRRYTTKDINDSVLPKFVRAALNEYQVWEEKTKDLLEEQCEKLNTMGMVADYEYIKEMLMGVENELKKVERMEEKLNGTGYDVNMIHTMQDKYHEKYKQKYNERFTKKYNSPEAMETKTKKKKMR